MQLVSNFGIGCPVIHFPSVPAGDDQTAGLQNPQVMGHRRGGHPGHGRDIRHTFLHMAENPEDPQPAGVVQLFHQCRHGRVSVSHDGQHIIGLRCVEPAETRTVLLPITDIIINEAMQAYPGRKILAMIGGFLGVGAYKLISKKRRDARRDDDGKDDD